MPRYNLQFDEALRAGLKPDSRVPRGTMVLEQCDYLRPTEFGLKDFLAVTQPLDDDDLTPGSETWTFPYPQLFRGASVTLLCFSDAVYEVDETTDPWTATELALYDAEDFGDTVPGAGSITAGGPWHFVDYFDTWVLTNGATIIFKTGHYSLPIATDAVTVTTACDLKGRFFMGGFDPSNFYAVADWPTYWKALARNAPPELQQKYEAMATGAGSNWVWWSTVGGGDMLWLISLELMTQGLLPAVEYLSNGTFTGAATGWALSGFSYSSNTITISATSGTATQTSATMVGAIRAGRSYSVTFTISGHSGGSVTPSIGAVSGTTRSADGTFTETIVAAADDASLVLTAAAASTLTVDNVSLTEVTPGTSQWSTADTPWDEILGRNEFGMAPLPWQGTVQCMKRLGETVVAYGDGGITALVPFSGPVGGMAPQEVHGVGMGVGLASRGSVGGSQDEHVFVDNAGELWRVSTDLRAQRLGYGYIFADLLGNPILVSFDAHRREYYISGYNGSSYECYVLTQTGLGRAPFVPTSVHFTEGGLVGILQGSTAAGAEIITNKFGSPDYKSLDEVETVTLISEDSDSTGWTVYVQYRWEQGDPTWTNSTGVVADIRGQARMNVSGLEFRIRCTHPDRTKADLDGIMVEMKSGGKRSLSPIT